MKKSMIWKWIVFLSLLLLVSCKDSEDIECSYQYIIDRHSIAQAMPQERFLAPDNLFGKKIYGFSEDRLYLPIKAVIKEEIPYYDEEGTMISSVVIQKERYSVVSIKAENGEAEELPLFPNAVRNTFLTMDLSSTKIAAVYRDENERESIGVWELDGNVCYTLLLLECTGVEHVGLCDIVLLEDDTCCLLWDQMIYVLDPGGTLLFSISVQNVRDASIQKSVAGDELYVIDQSDPKTAERQCRLIDRDHGKIGAKIPLPQQTCGGSWDFHIVDAHEIYLSNAVGFYFYDMKNDVLHLMCDWASCGFVGADIYGIRFISSEQILLYTTDVVSDEPILAVLHAADAAEQEERHHLVVACMNSDRSDMKFLQRCAAVFNRKQTACTLKLKYYGAVASEGMPANRALINDITQGEAIDCIFFSGELQADVFQSMGVLLDMHEFLDADESYANEAFLPCILSAYETSDGKLPVLTTDFTLSVLTGKAENLPHQDRWTYDACRAFLKEMEESQKFLYILDSSAASDAVAVLRTFCPSVLCDYMDTTAGTCNFDSDDFRSFLKLCEEMPVKRSREKQSTTIDDSIIDYKEDRILCYQHFMGYPYAGVRNVVDYLDAVYNFFSGEPLRWIGFPTGESALHGGVAAEAQMQFGILKTSEHPSYAWDFIKTYLDMQPQREQEEYHPFQSSGFPCTYRALEHMLQQFAQDDNVYRKMGLILYHDHVSSYMDANAAAHDRFCMFTEQDQQNLIRLIESADHPYSHHTEILNVIYDEASYYYSGVHSLDETVRRIQSRVGLYMSEQHG